MFHLNVVWVFHFMKKIDNLRNWYFDLPLAVKSTVWFVICNILQRGISLISTPIFTRLLTTEQYGVYSVYQSWYNIIAVFATLNLYCGVFNNGLTKFSNDKSRFTSAMQGLSTTITLIIAIIYGFGFSFWNSVFKMDPIYVVLIFIELLFVPAFQFWAVCQRYNYEYRALVIVTLLISGLSPVVGIISVLHTQHKAEARVFSYVLIQVAVGFVLYFYNISKGKIFYSKKYWSFALSFNLPLIPHYLSQIVLQQADRVMINSMVGTSEAGIYSIAYTLSTLMIIVTSAIEDSFVPFVYQHLKNGNYDLLKKLISVLLTFVGLCCVVVSLFGPELILLLASKSYYEARWIIPSVSASVYFIFLYNVFSNFEFYYEKTKFTMVASCVAALSNVVLNYIFIAKYGYIAAGYTTLVCYVIYAIAHGIIACRILKKYRIQHKAIDFASCYLISFLVLVFSLLITILYHYSFIRYFIVICVLVIAMISYKKVMMFFKNEIGFKFPILNKDNR